MPVPDQRDPEATRQVLTGWLSGHLPGAEVTHLETPETSGFSNETLIFDAAYGGRVEALVARVAPHRYQVFPEPRFEEQYRLMRILDEQTDIPVPPIRWYEPDPVHLGAPFFVMGRVQGLVPTDMPPYHQAGWVTEIDPAERATMWWCTLDILARLHRLDVQRLGLGFLDQPRWGETGLGQRLAYYEHYMHWAYPGPKDAALKALAWLTANRPEERYEPVALWGDARIGNVLFTRGVPQALLDWETAALGQPEEDLAWYLFLDRHHSEGIGVPRLEGFPGREETIAYYEDLLGRPMQDMAYYEVLSAFKFTVIMSRIGQAMIDFGWIEADNDFPHNNNCSQLLAKILEGLQ